MIWVPVRQGGGIRPGSGPARLTGNAVQSHRDSLGRARIRCGAAGTGIGTWHRLRQATTAAVISDGKDLTVAPGQTVRIGRFPDNDLVTNVADGFPAARRAALGRRRMGVREHRVGTDLPQRAAGHPGHRGPPARPGARLRGRAGAARRAGPCPPRPQRRPPRGSGRPARPAGGGYGHRMRLPVRAPGPTGRLPAAGAGRVPAARRSPCPAGTRLPRGRRLGRQAAAGRQAALGDEGELATALRILFPIQSWLHDTGWRQGLRLLVIAYALLPLIFLAMLSSSSDLSTPGWAYSLYVAPLWIMGFWLLIRPGPSASGRSGSPSASSSGRWSGSTS